MERKQDKALLSTLSATLQLTKEEQDAIDSSSLENLSRVIRNIDIRSAQNNTKSTMDFYVRSANQLAILDRKKSKTSSIHGLNKFSAGFASDNSGVVEKEMAAGADKFKRIVDSAETETITHLFQNEADRFKLYRLYDDIVFYIPQMAQALQVFVDNIISPDDFTKTSISFMKELSDEDSFKRISGNLKTIEKKYNLQGKLKRIVTESLKYGDSFLATLPLDKEIREYYEKKRKLERGNVNGNNVILNESNSSAELNEYFTPADFRILQEEAKELCELPDTVIEQRELFESMKSSFNSVIDSNIVFHENGFMYLEETLRAEEISAKFAKRRNKTKKAEGEKELSDKPITGSKLKFLDPKRVIKIAADGHTLGYYYIDIVDDRLNAIISGSQVSAESPSNTFYNSLYTLSANKLKANNAGSVSKDAFTYNMFIKAISTKIDDEFIRSNEQFKEIISNFLSLEYSKDKKLNIVFLTADEVTHFATNFADDSTYGTSIFSNILFISRIYMAVFTSTLMQKLTRAPSKRVFYVETGLDNDIEGAINQSIMDIKSKELRIDGFKDVETTMKNIGQFHDYFIPVIDGQKAIEMDSITTDVPEVDNEFLEYLRKAMTSGVGIPNAWLSYTDEIQFAKTLSQENGRFLRQIVGHQVMYNGGITDVYRKLYYNEFLLDEDDSDKEKDKAAYSTSDIESIIASLPSPASLNLTNLSDQTGNVQTVLGFITDAYTSTDSDNPDIQREFTLTLLKRLMPSMNWAQIEQEYEAAVISALARKTKAAAVADATSEA